MFKRVLIANRGEIAIRIARAAAALGVESVSVHAPADALALHTRVDDRDPADRRRRRRSGGGLSRHRGADRRRPGRRGCDCVHPGYGFLSENAEFARRCLRRGPGLHRPAAGDAGPVRRQGAGARRWRSAQGVPIVPGSHAALATRRRRRRRSPTKLGYPVMLKAAAGGGGRGMRAGRRAPARWRPPSPRCRARPRRRSATARCSSRSWSQRPRHIEVQILADGARRRRPPLRARLLGAAAQPEGRRDRPGAEPRRRRCAQRILRRRR